MPTEDLATTATELNSEVVAGTAVIVLATIGAGTTIKWTVNGFRKLNTMRVERKAVKANNPATETK